MAGIHEGGTEFLSAYDYQYARKNGIPIPGESEEQKAKATKNQENKTAFEQVYQDYNQNAAKVQKECDELLKKINDTAKKLNEAERRAEQLEQECKKWGGEKKYGAQFKDELQKLEGDYAMYKQMYSVLRETNLHLSKMTQEFDSAKSVALRDLVIDDDELKETQTNVGGASQQMAKALETSNQIKNGGVQFKSRETLEAEGKTFHAIAKNGTHFYEDGPKSDSNWLGDLISKIPKIEWGHGLARTIEDNPNHIFNSERFYNDRHKGK